MNGNKKRRGRPIGGKAPLSVREYWRNAQSVHRSLKKVEKKVLPKNKRGKV